jgi:ankyrin repeat protein
MLMWLNCFSTKAADVNAKDQPFGETALIAASKSGNLGLAQLLLDNRADINARTNTGMTPLTAAAHNCNTEMVKLLLNTVTYFCGSAVVEEKARTFCAGPALLD